MRIKEYGLEKAEVDHNMTACLNEVQELTNDLMRNFDCKTFFVIMGGYDFQESGFLQSKRNMPITQNVHEDLEGEGETIEQAIASISKFIPVGIDGEVLPKIQLKGYISLDDTETYIELPWSIQDKPYTARIRDDYYVENSKVQTQDFIQELESACMKELPKEEENRNIFESFLGNRQKGGFDASKLIRSIKDGKYDSEKVIVSCISALEERQKDALALKLVKQLQSDGILAKVFRKSGEFGTKEQ